MPVPFRTILIIHFQLDVVLSAAALFEVLLLIVAIGQLSYGEIEPGGLRRALVFPACSHEGLIVCVGGGGGTKSTSKDPSGDSASCFSILSKSTLFSINYEDNELSAKV